MACPTCKHAEIKGEGLFCRRDWRFSADPEQWGRWSCRADTTMVEAHHYATGTEDGTFFETVAPSLEIARTRAEIAIKGEKPCTTSTEHH